ncbi:MAG: phosphate signaling complex protein PhoU [Bdellovibrionaceae bacterium]|jgi:phosphate transport system protein|nr:phosphate signaling complex protein PhoU [Pseudobdellovibrionaceae bacterium]
MPNHLQNAISSLEEKLSLLSHNVEKQLKGSIKALKNRDIELAQKVITRDEEIDVMEVEVEEDCLKILALHQPVAIDLRYVTAVLKINNDLERVGDLAVNIAERAIYLSKKSHIEISFDFEEMTTKTMALIKKSLKSLYTRSTELAYEVIHEDEEIDDMNRKMYKRVYEEIKKAPENVKVLVHCLSISRHLERVGDYATNIAEDVIYMIEGKIIRHSAEVYED